MKVTFSRVNFMEMVPTIMPMVTNLLVDLGLAKKTGRGILYTHDGETIPGRWRNNKLVAEVKVSLSLLI